MIETSGFTTLRFEELDAETILRVTIDRPGSRLNAVDAALHHDLTVLFGRLRAERDLRAVILTGSDGAFSAGGDYDWFPELRTPERLAALRVDARSMIRDLVDCEVPIVAAVGGPAIGLGASIALLCDLVLASRDAVIGDPHVKVGLVAGDGGAVIWPIVVGPARAKEILLIGDSIDAATAADLGVVNRVVAPDDLADEALTVARRLAANPPLAVRATKAAVNAGVRARLDEVFDLAAALELTTFLSADHAEAVEALRERREPRFEGR